MNTRLAAMPRALTATRRLLAIGRVRIKKRQAIGLVLICILLAAFIVLNRIPKLDVAREDLAAVGSGVPGRCFQGFCVEYVEGTGFMTRWWSFTLTYLRLVAVGMSFAFLIAGLTEAFLFPGSTSRAFSGRGIAGALKGLIVGAPMTLCSACIVPISSAFRRRGAGIAATVGIAQGSSTLNLPAIVMAITVFAPILAGSRIVMSLLGALLIGPIASYAAGRAEQPLQIDASQSPTQESDPSSWREVFAVGFAEWARVSTRYLLRFGPLMVVAAMVSGFAIQWLSPEIVERFMGNDLAGIAIAATFGILINVPLLFEIPLVAALLLIGMGTAPAATLLFTAAAGGPLTFMGLARVMPRRAIAVFGVSTWILGVLGGLVVLGIAPLLSSPPLAGMQVRSVLERGDAEAEAATNLPAAGPVVFADVTDTAGLLYVQDSLRPSGSCLLGSVCEPERQSGGAAAADYDNDGYIDIYVTRLDAPDILFRNLGNGRFEDRTRDAGLHQFNLHSNGAVWFDADNDGDQDLYVTTIADTRFYMFVNDGQGRFTEEAISRGAAVETPNNHLGYSVAVGDYDRDGWLDLHVNEWGSSQFFLPKGAPSHARLLRNRGIEAPGHFEDVTVRAGVALEAVESQLEINSTSPSFSIPAGPFAFASTFVDLDSDGWSDLAVVSDNGYSRLFWNNGDGTFADGTIAAGVGTDKSGMGSTFGDYDADGDLDWFVTAIYSEFDTCEGAACDKSRASGNRLYRNEGGRLFSDVTDLTDVRNGGWGWGAVFFDYDNDGDLDLAMVGGMHESGDSAESKLDSPRLWENVGNGRMTEIAGRVGLSQPSAAKGLLTLDFDGDGDLDLFVVNNAGPPMLYRNDGGNANSWLRVRLIGEQSNRSAIGATIEVTPKIGAAGQIREMGVSSHFLGQSELVAHFGLGRAAITVDMVTIRWPVSGLVSILRDVPPNVMLIVREGQDGYQVVKPPS